MGAQCSFLKGSVELKKCLQAAGRKERFGAGQILFREEDNNFGVFLLLKGKIRMGVRGLPKLDRLFSAGSVLGLPSTFTGHPYSLTAEAVSEANVINVPQEAFVQLMRDRPELCREATEMLGREVTYIQRALAERRKQADSKRIAANELAVVM